MKKKDLTKHTIFLITEYYNNHIQPFLDAFANDCIWIGPAEGQIIRGRDALHETFAAENNQLTFSVEDLQAIPLSVNSSSLDVILTYIVTSYYPNGSITVFHQRTEIVWAQEKKLDAEGNPYREYAIRVCHISNEFPYADDDTIYPNHFTELEIAKTYILPADTHTAVLNGLNGISYYLSGSSILWVKCKSLHTIIHTVNHKVFETTEPISEIMRKYPDALHRVHASYAINPNYMESIGRFYIIMEDGTRIPVPERKYTKVKRALHAYWKKD